MRLTLVISGLPVGGAQRVLSTMAGYWAEKGWPVHLVTFDDGKQAPFYPLHPAVVRLPLGVAGDSAGPARAVRNNFRRLRALRAALRETAPEVVLSFIDQTNVLTLLAARGLGLPVVVSERSDPRHHSIARHWALLRRFAYPLASAVVVQTEGALRYFPRSVRRRGRVIPNPVLAPAEEAPPGGRGSGRRDKAVLLALGRLAPEKGFDLLLRAFARVAPRHPRWSLDLWGEGPARAELEALAGDLGLGGRVRLPGATREPLAQLRRADLFVLPSRYEGFPNALCEALACGLPAVSFDCPSGPREILRHGVDGLLVPRGDVEALAGALDRLMGDEGERKRMALRAPEVLTRFGLPRVMGLWEDLLAEAAGETAAPAGAGPRRDSSYAARARVRRPVPILFLIRSLESGGAERQLVELVKGLDKASFAVTVATFYDGGALRPELERVEGVRVVSLHKRGRWDVLGFLYRLWRTVREVKPRVVHGYMGVANELASLMARAQGAKGVWGLRASHMDFSRYDWTAAWVYRVGAWLSRSADLIIVNSRAGRRYHVAHGYCGRRMVVIPNGVDTERFRPDREAGRKARAEWGVGEGEPLIGVVGRLDPMKDHPTFLRAAALLARERPDVRFVCVGDGPAPYKARLRALAGELGLGGRLVWAGHRKDLLPVYNALDVATSSSSGEGLPNVIVEALACEVPCVVTDVGDSAAVVGGVGEVVPPGSPGEMKVAWVRLLGLPAGERAALGRAGRERARGAYGAEQLARRTEDALAGLLGGAVKLDVVEAVVREPGSSPPFSYQAP